jgi:hypothetical protein
MGDVVDAELHYADDTHAIGSLGIVFINIVRKPANLAMLRETRRQVQRHFRRWNNRSAALSVIEPSAAQALTKEVRDESAALTGDFPSRAAATVIEGSGFRAAATRTAMVGLFLLSRPKYPHKVCGSVADGAKWLVATVADLGVTPEALVRAVEITRRAFK